MICTLQPACSLCDIYLHMLSLLSPDCCSRLTAKMTTKINQEIFKCKIRKEWWQMGTFRNSKKYCLLIFVIVSNMFSHIYLLISYILLILRLFSFWHKSMYVWTAPHTNSSLLLKDSSSEFFFLYR